MIGRKVWRSPSVLLTICCFGVCLISGVVRGVALGGRLSAGGGPGEAVEPLPQNLGDEVEEGDGGEVMGVGVGNRVKRSRDVQQFCGYRLLDALRSVCDRNFVGFTRRSDPSFLRDANNNGLEGLSSEDIGIFGGNPWEIAFMTLEGTGGGGNQAVGDNSLWGLEGNQGLDYLVESQQQQNQQPIFGRNSAAGGVGVGRGSSSPVGISSSGPGGSKAFALKLLTEPPKTHQRFRRNIIDECCKKPCAMNQMLKYCAITAVGKRSF